MSSGLIIVPPCLERPQRRLTPRSSRTQDHPAYRHSDHVVAIFEYSTALFDRATVERLADNFLTLVDSALSAPDTAPGDQPYLSVEVMAAGPRLAGIRRGRA